MRLPNVRQPASCAPHRPVSRVVRSAAPDTPKTERLLRRYLEPLVEAGADQLVLGCTHYPFLRPVIERVVGPGVAVIDPAPAVARQTAHVLARRGLEANPGHVGRHVFYTSGDTVSFAGLLRRLVPAVGEGVAVSPVRWRGGARLGVARKVRSTARRR